MTITVILVVPCLIAASVLLVYCHVLSKRLRRLNNLEAGLGGAIAVMTTEISRLDQAIRRARAEAEAASCDLARTVEASRSEKAYWALQAELSKGAHGATRRLRPRHPAMEDVHG